MTPAAEMEQRRMERKTGCKWTTRRAIWESDVMDGHEEITGSWCPPVVDFLGESRGDRHAIREANIAWVLKLPPGISKEEQLLRMAKSATFQARPAQPAAYFPWIRG